MAKTQLDIVVSVLLILFGAWVLSGAFSYGITSNIGPGSGLFPLIAGALILGLSLVNLFRTIKGSEQLEGDVALREIVPTLFIFCLAIAYLWSVDFLGIFLPLPVFLVLVSLSVHWRVEPLWLAGIGLGAIAFSALCYLIFAVALSVPVPRGPLGF